MLSLNVSFLRVVIDYLLMSIIARDETLGGAASAARAARTGLQGIRNRKDVRFF